MQQLKISSNTTSCLCCSKILIGRYQKKYCSRSCSAKINNKIFVKRKKIVEGKCKFCGNVTKLKRIKTCKECISSGKHKKSGKNFEMLTLKEILLRKQRYCPIRDHARRKFFKDGIKCENCNYSKHIHICHKKPIKSFNLSDTIEQINNRKNILFLCPNCHWEYDNLGLPPAGFKPASCPDLEHP